MSFAKTIEMSAQSPNGFQEAAERGAERANETLENIQSIWVKDQELSMDNGKIVGYKVHLKVTFQMK